LRAVDREIAVRILHGLTEYGESGRGDLKALAGQWQGYFRLRIGEYRVIFAIAFEEITIARVRHRSEAYR
jgi:mRNA-degrading endonuclease RelE of RelBE toxin-antitoxin system